MNIAQRIVLMAGAVALLVVLATTGTHPQIDNPYSHIWDWQSALVRGLIISGVTFALYFAVGKRKL